MQNIKHWTEKYNPDLLSKIAGLINNDKIYDFIKSQIDFDAVMLDFITFATFACELQKQACAKVADAQILYDDDFLEGIGCSVNHAKIVNTPNVCQI